MFKLFVPSLFIAATLTSCFTPQKEKAIREDIFTLQTRVIELENQLNEKGKTLKTNDDAATRRIASTASEIERLTVELQRMRGDIDALKVGVKTGAMPGQDPAEPTVAAAIAALTQRLDAVEATQQDLAKGRSSRPTTSTAGAAAAKTPIQTGPNVASLRAAFEAKKYTQVTDDAPKVMARGNLSKSNKEWTVFYEAESLYKLGKLRESALKFNELMDLKPADKEMNAQARLRMGDCFRHLGDASTSKLYYQELIKLYPNSQQASSAKEHLSEVGGSKGAAAKTPVTPSRPTTNTRVARPTPPRSGVTGTRKL